ncbi:cytochrome P450 family protein [Micromonospora sp. WMMD736]|uniref:cytochrome P450 family protein n=1 Tax=Micromonospora sp. WMMD736 TaxID=3404112 RepID=UPI003B953DE6
MLTESPLTAPFDEDYFADPYRRYAQLNDVAPVHRITTPTGVPVWLLTGYEEVRAALTDKRFARGVRYAGPGYVQDVLPGPLRSGNVMTEDPPEHTRLRRFINFAFLPKRVAALRPNMQQIVDQSLDAIAGSGSADLMPTLAAPLPITVIGDILGVPDADRADFGAWMEGLFGGDPAVMQEAGVQMVGFLHRLLALKTATPGDDLLSHLVTAEDENGERQTEQELIGQAFVLLFGGYDTTYGMIGAGAITLLRDPELLEQVRARPELLPRAIEEVLRYYGTAHTGVRRFATEDVTIGSVTIPAGDTVLLSLAAANRDPREFPVPDRVDIHRSNLHHHIAFGRGPHHCPGSELSRHELHVALETLLRRFPKLQLAVPAEEIAWRPSYIFRVPLSVPVTF